MPIERLRKMRKINTCHFTTSWCFHIFTRKIIGKICIFPFLRFNKTLYFNYFELYNQTRYIIKINVIFMETRNSYNKCYQNSNPTWYLKKLVMKYSNDTLICRNKTIISQIKFQFSILWLTFFYFKVFISIEKLYNNTCAKRNLIL